MQWRADISFKENREKVRNGEGLQGDIANLPSPIPPPNMGFS